MTARTVSEILASIKASTIAENPNLSDWSLNSMNRKTTIPICMEIQKLETKIETVGDAQNINTATGADLDDLVKDRGLTRLAGTKASGLVNFTRTSAATADVTIPEGTEVSAKDTDGEGPVYFVTIEGATIPTGSTSIGVTVEASAAGNRGNVRAAAIDTIEGGAPGVDYVINPLAMTGGADEESDDDLRDRYIATATDYGRATVPTMKERIEALANDDEEKIVAEAKVYNIGRGDIEVIVDCTPTSENIELVGDGLIACMAAGVSARGCLAAHLESGANLGDIGDTAGGKIYVRARKNITSEDTFTLDYVNSEGATHTASFTVPAGTTEGQSVEGTLAISTDEVVSVPTPSYAGSFEYDVLVGYGTPPYLFVVPEKVSIDVAISYVATDTPESDLADLIEASITAFLDDFTIGAELQFSDLYDAARMQYLGDGEWGERFYGIEEITSLSATDGVSTITALGEKITPESDQRIDPGTVTPTEV